MPKGDAPFGERDATPEYAIQATPVAAEPPRVVKTMEQRFSTAANKLTLSVLRCAIIMIYAPLF